MKLKGVSKRFVGEEWFYLNQVLLYDLMFQPIDLANDFTALYRVFIF